MKLTLIGCGIFLGVGTSMIILHQPGLSRFHIGNSDLKKKAEKDIPVQKRMMDLWLADGFDFPFGDENGQG